MNFLLVNIILVSKQGQSLLLGIRVQQILRLRWTMPPRRSACDIDRD